MKKTITSLFVMLACAFSAQAQTNSYPFDASDVDEDGWLWFDTPEKIEKYVGVSKDGKLDPNGKIFQMVTTNAAASAQKPFNQTFATDTIHGWGDPHDLENTKKQGAIVLHVATENATAKNGGAILINLPSCKTMHMNLSCEGAANLYLSGSKDATADTSAYSVVYKPAETRWPNPFTGQDMIMYTPLFQTNIHVWSGIEALNDNGNTEFTLASKEPVYAMLQSAAVSPIYIHGVRIVTEPSTGIQDITADAIQFDGQNITLDTPAQISVYTIDGSLVSSAYGSKVNLAGLSKGIYLVKAGNATQKVAIK